MSTEYVVMEKNFGRMRIPIDQLQDYLKAGWVEIERVTMSDSTPNPKDKKAAKPEAAKAEADD